MSVTVASFVVRYPEFVDADAALIAACLVDAAAKCNAGAWGTVYDQAVSLQAAHMLALSPFGLGLQLGVRRDAGNGVTSDNGATVYEQQYLELRASTLVGLIC